MRNAFRTTLKAFIYSQLLNTAQNPLLATPEKSSIYHAMASP
jgi:hypothetical protein